VGPASKIMVIERNENIIDKTDTDLELLHSFKNFPVFMGCTDQDQSKDLLQDMNWYISRKNGMIQLNPFISPDIVYKEPHGSGTVGGLWKEHHEEFAKFVIQYKVGRILELGSSHGILYQNANRKDLDWTIVEPNYYGPKDSANLKIIPAYFDSKLDLGKKYDTIVHSHVFEHILDLEEFFETVDKHLYSGGNMVFSIPNFDYLLFGGTYHVLNFEHTFLLREVYVDYILQTNGFEIYKKQDFKNHSIFYYAKYIGGRTGVKVLDNDLYRQNKNYVNNTIYNMRDDVGYMNITSLGRKVYLFGGHIFSQFLLNLGLKENSISAILDNDVKKQGKRLYGSSLIVNDPMIIKNDPDPYVIVFAGVYTEEIKRQLRNINERVVFL